MPAPKAKPIININILFPQGIPQKLPIKFLKWLLSYGRFMAVAVEIVVVATFVVRFKLDSDLANLNDQINHQVPYIESLSTDEAKIRQTQFKIATVKKFYDSDPDLGGILTSISSQMTPGTRLSTVNIDTTDKQAGLQFRFNGIASSSNDLSILLAGLKQVKIFKDITLSNISYDQGQLTFSISGGLKNQPWKNKTSQNTAGILPL